MKKNFALMLAAAIIFAGCKKDKAEEPSLDTDKTAITAVPTAGSYTIAVTGNVAWTVTVSSGASWCTASPASGNGDGTVTVSVAENTAIETRSATVIIISGTLNKTVTVTQAAAAPALSVDKTDIAAVYTAAGYPVAVTSNATWTVTVSSGTTWCTASPASGNGNGTVTVSVVENPILEPRIATVTIASGSLSKAVVVTQDACPTPVYAASTQTWTFTGSTLTWSDAIRIPDCDKADFESSSTEPQCRSYTDDESNTWYYYNWAYVTTNAAALCPSPWHVPTKDDIDALLAVANAAGLVADWGYGGYNNSSSVYDVSTSGHYWSSTELNTTNAYYMRYYSGDLLAYNTNKGYGFQVRCVK